MNTQETYRAGDPVVHAQTRKLLGTLRKDITFDANHPEAIIRKRERPDLRYAPRTYEGGTEEAMASVVHAAWLRPAFYTEGVRVLWLSTTADPQAFAHEVYHPAGATSDHEIVKVGDAARVVLNHMDGESMKHGMFGDVRALLHRFVSRADSYRKYLEEKG